MSLNDALKDTAPTILLSFVVTFDSQPAHFIAVTDKSLIHHILRNINTVYFLYHIRLTIDNHDTGLLKLCSISYIYIV